MSLTLWPLRLLAVASPAFEPSAWLALAHALPDCQVDWQPHWAAALDHLHAGERYDALAVPFDPQAVALTDLRAEHPHVPVVLLTAPADEWQALTVAAAHTAIECVIISPLPDLTAARLALALRRAAERAAALEHDTLAFTAAHDLQAPATSIRNFAQLLQHDDTLGLDTRARDYLNRIQANAEFMESLLRELLELAQIGQTEHPDEALPVEPVVRQALADLAMPLTERRVRLTLPKRWPTVRYSRARLRQIFFNLISNAIKFLGAQPDPLLELGWQVMANQVEFWVRDNGVGIAPHDHKRIFNPFERLHAVNATGTGMGLSIIKRIIEARGGHIRLESAPGLGATFFFTVPLAL